MRQILFLISLCLLISSCNDKRQTLQNAQDKGMSIPSEITVINAEKAIKLDYTDLMTKVTDLKYVYLNTEEPIGEIKQLLLHNERIYIFDRLTEQVFIFDMNGNLIKLISNMGGGPDEYSGISDITINNDTLIIKDKFLPKILFYSPDGEYFGKETFSPPGSDFIVFKGRYYLTQGYKQSFDRNDTYLLVSLKDSIICKTFPYYNIQKDAAHGKALQFNSKGELLFTPDMCDTVYQILNDTTYTAKYLIKHKNSIWKRYNENLSRNEVTKLQANDGYTQLMSGISDIENSLAFSLSLANAGDRYIIIVYYWYDKKTGLVYEYAANSAPVIHNVNENPTFCDMIAPPFWFGNNYYISQITPQSVEDIRNIVVKSKEIFKDKGKVVTFPNKELKRIFDEINDDPNQVLVFYKLDFNK
jgi:hypothetical protein